ncbi:MAG: hypothetical protein AMJ63_11805 [Myxococcales bacterium SG8_38_1]|nr:MAG: hypothetical protein AMJ63_11805 [Myxococcales bacterium SG8_38_1]
MPRVALRDATCQRDGSRGEQHAIEGLAAIEVAPLRKTIARVSQHAHAPVRLHSADANLTDGNQELDPGALELERLSEVEAVDVGVRLLDREERDAGLNACVVTPDHIIEAVNREAKPCDRQVRVRAVGHLGVEAESHVAVRCILDRVLARVPTGLQAVQAPLLHRRVADPVVACAVVAVEVELQRDRFLGLSATAHAVAHRADAATRPLSLGGLGAHPRLRRLSRRTEAGDLRSFVGFELSSRLILDLFGRCRSLCAWGFGGCLRTPLLCGDLSGRQQGC